MRANLGHVPSYGADPLSFRLTEVVKHHFGPSAEVFPVLTGTGANVVCLAAASPRWGAVVCAEGAHVTSDEGGAAEKVAGLKLLEVPAPDGRLTPEAVMRRVQGRADEHRPVPSVLSITQSSELGTVYGPDQVAALAEVAHRLGMRLHLDGARLSNAAAHLGAPLRQICTEAGVDLVSLGGTKNGCLMAEAVVVLDPELCEAVRFIRKGSMQLGSKLRFVSAQLVALFEGDLWLELAGHANAMASRLAAGLEEAGVNLAAPVQANSVFAYLPERLIEPLRSRFGFYDWGEGGLARLMCSWDTTEDDVDEFVMQVNALGGRQCK